MRTISRAAPNSERRERAKIVFQRLCGGRVIYTVIAFLDVDGSSSPSRTG